jgi:general secretion pathway protein G
MKTIVVLATCLWFATLSWSQAASAPKDQQEKESQLRTELQQMRDAIDHYHGMAMRGKIMVPVGSEGYPMDLQTLVNGAVDAHDQTIHFLPKIPVDPITGTTDWGVKHLRNLPQAAIFDVYTESDATGSDGTKYKDW